MVNEWSHKWLLKFNVDKCKLLQLGNSSPANYYLSSPDGFFRSLICKVTEEKDLERIVYRVVKNLLEHHKSFTMAILVSLARPFSSPGAYRLEIISTCSERVWYTDCQISVTDSTLLPWELIGVKS